MGTASRVYDGWKVVVGLFLAGMMVYGAGLYGFSLLIPPLSAEFGWSRAATGGLVSIFWLAAPLTPLGGIAIARLGAGWVICLGIVLASVCLAFVGLIDSLPLMYGVRAVMGVGKIMMMAGVTAQASAWFRRRFGLAIAICFGGWHFGGLTLAPLAQWLIDDQGWRRTCFILAASIVAVALPPMLIWGRRRAPANLPAEEMATVERASAPILRQWTVRSALRCAELWRIIAITVLAGLTYGGLLTHEAALVQSSGISPSESAAALGLTAGAALAGTLITGYFSDRFPFRPVMAIVLLSMLAGCAGFTVLLLRPDLPLLFPAAITFGVSVGGFDTCITTRLQRVFGAEIFSHVFGFWYFFYLAILLLGPMLIGHLFDIAGNYSHAGMLMTVSVAAAVALVLMRSRQAVS